MPVKDRVDEWYLEIRDVGTGKLVTVIEVLSPTNKSHGAGRKKYCKNRNRIFDSNTSLIEIDLLRAGKPMPISDPRAGGERLSYHDQPWQVAT